MIYKSIHLKHSAMIIVIVFFIQKYKRLNFGKVSIFINIYFRYKLKIKVLELSKD